jgi:AAA domain/RepB DNA-primase from phage plasmid/Primase C terminal 2 (PriCT-2)
VFGTNKPKAAPAQVLPKWAEARRFIAALRGDGKADMRFRAVPDSQAAKTAFAMKTKAKDYIRLNYVGTLGECRADLEIRQGEEHGVFYGINPTDGGGHKKGNITAVTVLPIDLDGAPLPKRWAGGLVPHIIIETSPGRFQALYLIEPTTDFPLAKNTVQRLAKKYSADPSVCDSARVLRLPGTLHLKNPAKPFVVRIVSMREFDAPYRLEDFDAHLPKQPLPEEREPGEGIGELSPARAAKLFDALDVGKFDNNKDWEEIAMAVHAASDNDPDVKHEFLEWCKSDGDYADDESMEYRWDSFNVDGGRGVGTLRHIVRREQHREDVSPELFAEIFNQPVEFEDDLTEDDAAPADDDDSGDDLDFNTPAAPKPKPKKKKSIEYQTAGRLSYVGADQVKMEKINWLWHDRFACGKVNFLVGRPDKGKSQLLAYLTAKVSTGDEWYNGGNAPKGTVLVLSAEDSPADTIVPRLRAAGADVSKVQFIKPTVKTIDKKGERSFDLSEDIKQLDYMLKLFPDTQLITIDPISSYLGKGGPKGTNSHANTEVRAVLLPLKEWAEATGVCVVFVSHFNKGGNHTSALNMVTDSQAFTAVARMGWFVADDPENEGRLMLVNGKKNVGKATDGLCYRIKSMDVKSHGVTVNAPFIAFDGTTPHTAESVLMVRNDKKPGAMQLAETFLTEFLALRGKSKAEDVKKEAELYGHNWKTVQAVRAKCGVISKQEVFRGPHMWRLRSAIDDFDDLTDDAEMEFG